MPHFLCQRVLPSGVCNEPVTYGYLCDKCNAIEELKENFIANEICKCIKDDGEKCTNLVFFRGYCFDCLLGI